MKTAIIGCGFMGSMHAQVYASLSNASLAAVVDIFPDSAKEKLQALGIDVPVYTGLERLLHEVDIEAVDICSPTDQHEELAKTAAAAGKHLFIEKPLAFDLESCREIRNAVEEAGVFAQVGHCIRFWPEYIALKEFIDSGKGGKLKSLSLQRRAARPAYSQGDWLNNESRSGGAAFDLHIHDTDFIIHLLGLPRSVYSKASQGRSGPDHVFTLYDYDAVAVHAEGGWDYPGKYGFCMAFEAVFEHASIAYNSASGKPLTLALANAEPVAMTVQQPGPKESCTGGGNIASLGGYYNQIEYFTNCIKTGKAPQVATIAQATDSVRVTLAELESALSAQPITIQAISKKNPAL